MLRILRSVVDGALAVAHSNGHVSYVYQIAQAPSVPFPLERDLELLRFRRIFTFQDYDAATLQTLYALERVP